MLLLACKAALLLPLRQGEFVCVVLWEGRNRPESVPGPCSALERAIPVEQNPGPCG